MARMSSATILPPRTITADLVARIEATNIPKLKVPEIVSNEHACYLVKDMGEFDQWGQDRHDVKKKVAKNMRLAGYVWNDKTKAWEHGLPY